MISKWRPSPYPLISGQPWLVTDDAYIRCRSRGMLISDGSSTKKLSLYPLAKPKYQHENVVWIEDEHTKTDLVKPVLSIEKALSFREEIKDDIIDSFLNNVNLFSLSTSQLIETIMHKYDLLV